MSSVSAQIEAWRTPPPPPPAALKETTFYSCFDRGWDAFEEPIIQTDAAQSCIRETAADRGGKEYLTCPLRGREANWRASVVWSGQCTQNAENALFGCGGEKNPPSSQSPISVVYNVGSKHLFTRGCFFPPLSPSLSHGPWSDSTAAPQQSGCGHRRTNLRGLLTLHCATMRSEERLFSSSAQRSDFSLAPWEQRQIMNSLGPRYHVRFHTRQLHSGAEQKGAVGETFVGAGNGVPRGMPCRVSLVPFWGILMEKHARLKLTG